MPFALNIRSQPEASSRPLPNPLDSNIYARRHVGRGTWHLPRRVNWATSWRNGVAFPECFLRHNIPEGLPLPPEVPRNLKPRHAKALVASNPEGTTTRLSPKHPGLFT